jgi:NAD(P)-dependent dehydrogenase (short-subunit alcohol dehydrogenase family)
MVKFSLIKKSNSQIDGASAPRVAVFVGGTSGVGKLTLGAIAKLGTTFKAYVVGRKESEASFKPFAESLHEANPNAEIVWIEGQVSLLSEAKRVCDHIKTLESSIDLLFMTTGYVPFGGRQSESFSPLPMRSELTTADTSEGLDISHALEFYTRICFTQNLLPLLRSSGRARVISVRSPGLESEWMFNPDDLLLEAPGAFGGIATQRHMSIMGTLALERLAEIPENQQIVFMHSHPG